MGDGLISNNCTAIARDSDRGIWVGTDAGITRLTYPTAPPWTSYAMTDFLNGVNIRCIYVEPHPWSQITSIEIADVNGDGQKDLVVASNGYVFYDTNPPTPTTRNDEMTKWDVQHPINGKLSVLPQTFSGGAFKLSDYVPNAPGREVIFTSVSTATEIYTHHTPHYRRGIAVGKVTSDYGPDIFISGYRDKYIGHFKYVVTP